MLQVKRHIQNFLVRKFLSYVPGVLFDSGGVVRASQIEDLAAVTTLIHGVEVDSCFVSLCGNYFVKVNKITGLRKIFRYAFSSPKRFSLVHEFGNLALLSSTGLSPQPKVLMVEVGFFGVRETLCTEYFKGAMTLQEYLKASVDRKIVLELVSHLFLQSWRSGFTHLDPHLNNIVIYPLTGRVYFVDFEGCKISVLNKELHFGFLLGRFYNYWFKNYMDEQEYDAQVLAFLHNAELGLSFSAFYKWYSSFKHDSFSRGEAEKIFGLHSRAKGSF